MFHETARLFSQQNEVLMLMANATLDAKLAFELRQLAMENVCIIHSLNAQSPGNTSIERVKRQIGTSLRKQTACWEIQLERRRAQTRIADLKRRIAAIAARLEKEGVSRETHDVIAMKAVYDRAKNYQGRVNRAQNTDRNHLDSSKAPNLGLLLCTTYSI
jgi:hypothetical protein